MIKIFAIKKWISFRTEDGEFTRPRLAKETAVNQYADVFILHIQHTLAKNGPVF